MIVHYSIDLPYVVSMKQNKAKFATVYFSCWLWFLQQKVCHKNESRSLWDITSQASRWDIRQKDGVLLRWATGILWNTQTRLYVLVLIHKGLRPEALQMNDAHGSAFRLEHKSLQF